MTRDDIIRMAKEAGWARPNHVNNPWSVSTDALERFHALAIAAERERVAAWMRSKSYATGHGDTTEDLLKELEWQVAEREREACAKVCKNEEATLLHKEGLTLPQGNPMLLKMASVANFCAAAIRARGEQEQPR